MVRLMRLRKGHGVQHRKPTKVKRVASDREFGALRHGLKELEFALCYIIDKKIIGKFQISNW